MKAFLFLTGLFFTFSTSLSAKTFELDPVHSHVGFKIRHLLTNVKGRFTEFQGKIELGDKGLELTKAEATVKTSSIDTDNTKRDDHLRSPDFFDVAKFPEMKFVSDAIKVRSGKTGKMPGKLTIHGVTKPVTFEVEYFGAIPGPDGSLKAGASASAKIDRRDFGLTWSKVLETGGVMVGDEVTILLEIEGNEVKMADAKK